MTIDLTSQEVSNLIALINVAQVKGSDVEIVSALKGKIISAANASVSTPPVTTPQDGNQEANASDEKGQEDAA